MAYQNYSEKLKDPRWQKKRLEILTRDKFTCTQCGDSKTTLHIHHSKYSSSGNPWDVDSCYLTTFCMHCHATVEYFKTQKEFTILGIKKVFCLNGVMVIQAYLFDNNILEKSVALGNYENEKFKLIMIIREVTMIPMLDYLQNPEKLTIHG